MFNGEWYIYLLYNRRKFFGLPKLYSNKNNEELRMKVRKKSINKDKDVS